MVLVIISEECLALVGTVTPCDPGPSEAEGHGMGRCTATAFLLGYTESDSLTCHSEGKCSGEEPYVPRDRASVVMFGESSDYTNRFSALGPGMSA